MAASTEDDRNAVPPIGSRVELRRGWRTISGTIVNADERYALIQWDEGGATTIRVDRRPLRVVDVTKS